MKKIILTLTFLLFSILGFSYAEKSASILDDDHFNKIRNEEGTLLVDARYNDYYNGWKDPITNTNGHLKGATDFSANWLKENIHQNNSEYVQKRLSFDVDNKGIKNAKNVVIYSSNLEEAQSVANYFMTQGIDASKLFVYLVKNSPNEAFITVEHYEKLVSPKFIHDLLTENKAENYTNNQYQIFEVSWGSSKGSYDKGHIPHSVHIDTGDFEHPPLWALNNDEDLLQFAKKYGINKDATIILYGEEQMAAFRTAIILEYMGAKDVRVLNGGLNAYKNAGYELSTTPYKAEQLAQSTFDFSGKNLIDTYDDITKKISDKWQLIDARTKDEHEGKTSGYDYLSYKGTIPNSIFHGAQFAENSGSVADYVNVDNTMRNINDITKMLSSSGINLNNHMSFYCGTGWRVSQILFYLQINGYPNSSIYSNGWAEYSDKNHK